MIHKIPNGWTKGERLTVERKGAYIVISQARDFISFEDKPLTAHHVATVNFHATDWKPVTSFLKRWLA